MKMENYSDILRKIQGISKQYQNGRKKDFFDNVVDNIFLKELGYRTKDLYYNREECTVDMNGLSIRSTTEDNWERELWRFVDYLSTGEGKTDNKYEWGIFIHPWGMCLLNEKVEGNSENYFTVPNKVLEIIYGLNTDQKYFKYFSRENTIGKDKNAYFYKDIISYKNTKYKGTEKSWVAYRTTLKRFFNYYVENRGNYNCYAKNVYDNIDFSFFCDFIRNGTKAKSIQTVKNEFFHVKEMICDKTSNGQFDRSAEDLSLNFPKFIVKSDFLEIQNIDNFINSAKIKNVLAFGEKKRNALRNKAILLFLFAYGLERRKLCSLEWDKNVLTSDALLEMEGKKYPMPTYLKEVLEKLKENANGCGLVFENNGKPLNEGTFNTILSGFREGGDDLYYQLSPANIRRGLAKYLLWNGYPLEKIFYLMDIDGKKLESYITADEITKAVWNNSNKLNCSMVQHPLEEFFEELR